MLMTSDYAQKMIKKLEEEKSQLNANISSYSTFVVSIVEGDPEELRPEFDLKETVEKIEEIEKQILKIKHARNLFNAQTILDGTDLTIDVALIRMAILNQNYRRYVDMGNKQQKTRRSSYGDNVEYTYTNYDITYAKELGESMYNELLSLQEKLNLVNSTIAFEVE